MAPSQNVLFFIDQGAQFHLPPTLKYTTISVSKNESFENQALELKKTYWDLIMVYTGCTIICEEVQLFIVQQQQMYHVPIMLFAFGNVNNMQLEHLLPMNPLTVGPQTGMGNQQSEKSSVLVATDPEHAILRNVKKFSCPSGFRAKCSVRTDIPPCQVIATWPDQVPLIVERTDLGVLAMNFCIFNMNTATDAFKLISNAVRYMIMKYARKHRKLFFSKLYKTIAFCDVCLQFQ